MQPSDPDLSQAPVEVSPKRQYRSHTMSNQGLLASDANVGSRWEDLPPTLSVEEAGRLCGIGRNAAYRAAAAGELPTFRLGRQLRVPTTRLLEMLGLAREAA